MTVRRSVVEQFGPAARDYATFAYHAKGPDLAPMLAASELNGSERVLDVGCGPGHTALLFATKAREVVALDPTQAMLDEARRLAAARSLGNIRFEQATAEDIPFDASSFDRVVSRQSAHHWSAIDRAMAEIGRVLKPEGRFVLVDTFAPEDPAFDSFLNRIELLRDPSHVRDYRVIEWSQMFAAIGLELELVESWWLALEFDPWVKRSRTPDGEIGELRRCFDAADSAVAERFRLTTDYGFEIPFGLVVGHPPQASAKPS